MTKLDLIGLAGPIGSGKTTIARSIQALVPGTYVVSFSMPVKKIARECFGWNGEKDERGRRLLQRIGTDCGRAYNEDIWARKLMKEIHSGEFDTARLIVIDDLRFDNEACAVKLHGGFVIHLDDRAAEQTSAVADHSSEAGIDKSLVDFFVSNKRTPIETAVDILRVTKLENTLPLRPSENVIEQHVDAD